MKSQRVIAAVAAVAALGAGALTAQSATAAPAKAPVVKVAVKKGSAQDGRALFAGLFFLQGEAGKALSKSPYFSDPDGRLRQNDTLQGKLATAKVLDTIAKQRPEFFASFSAKLRSGRPAQVEAGLKSAGAALRDAVRVNGGGTGTSVGNGQGYCGFAIAVAAVNSVAAVNLGAAVNVVVTANVLTKTNFWFGAPPKDVQDNPLAAERAVADLTKRLAA